MPHMDTDKIKSVAQDIGTIAGDMPQGVSYGEDAVSEAESGNDGQAAVKALGSGFSDWTSGFKTLTKQVDGFSKDLEHAAENWRDTDDVNADAFKDYGTKL